MLVVAGSNPVAPTITFVKSKSPVFYTITLLPSDGRKGLEFRVHYQKLKWILGGVSLLFTALLLIGLMAWVGVYRLTEYRRLKIDSLRHHNEMEQMRSRYRSIENQVEQIRLRQDDIRRVLGNEVSSVDISTDGLDQTIERLKGSVKESGRHVKRLSFRYAMMPSMSPVYGPLSSSYGWRFHPVQGRMAFHQGIDIPGWIGAPIRAAADGIVLYSGWSRGFGQVVVIDHFYGYRTIYAHSSKLVARRGDTVQKGQVIAEVGNTGHSTGPHVHYEVRRYDQPVDPIPYLDLTLVAAQSRM